MQSALDRSAISALLAFPFSGTARDTDFKVALASRLGLDAIDRVTPAIRRQPNGEAQVVIENLPGGGHATSGKIVFHMKERRKKMISSRMIGEISMPPRLGSRRRIGRSSGSVTL